jgi:anti-sigma regulatory factor (Ser/Thr protein kinase)
MRRQLLDRITELRVDHDEVALAVSEAVANSVRYAYPDAPGTVTLTASQIDRALTVTVTDSGRGIAAALSDPVHAWRSDTHGLGLGLPIMHAITDELVISDTGEGTTVWMSFHFHR